MAIERTKSFNLGLNYLEETCCPSSGFQNDCVGVTRGSLEKKFFPHDNFANLLALEHLGDLLSPRVRYTLRKQICPHEPCSGDETVNDQFSYTNGKGIKPLYTGVLNFNKMCKFLPDDSETTALYHYIHLRDGMLERKDRRIMDISRLLFLNTKEDGIIRLYFPPMDEGRLSTYDPGCIANVLKFLYYYGTEPEWFQKSEDFLLQYLTTEDYLGGARYYHSPDVFLYHMAEAVSQCPRALARFKEPLFQQLQRRVSHLLSLHPSDRFPLDFAMTVLSLGALQAFSEAEFKGAGEKLCSILVGMQMQKEGQECKMGSWPKDTYYKKGKTPTFLGGEQISTIFAVAALNRFEQQQFS